MEGGGREGRGEGLVDDLLCLGFKSQATIVEGPGHRWGQQKEEGEHKMTSYFFLL